MKNLNMFCLTLEPSHYKFIKELGYIPVGLGDKNFDDGWFRDKSGINISKKNGIDVNTYKDWKQLTKLYNSRNE